MHGTNLSDSLSIQNANLVEVRNTFVMCTQHDMLRPMSTSKCCVWPTCNTGWNFGNWLSMPNFQNISNHPFAHFCEPQIKKLYKEDLEVLGSDPNTLHVWTWKWTLNMFLKPYAWNHPFCTLLCVPHIKKGPWVHLIRKVCNTFPLLFQIKNIP